MGRPSGGKSVVMVRVAETPTFDGLFVDVRAYPVRVGRGFIGFLLLLRLVETPAMDKEDPETPRIIKATIGKYNLNCG